MSTENNEAVADADEVCASCGKAEVDDVKLQKCDDCDLVKYCNDDCQENHRPQHKKACKKRLAELRDIKLLAPPEISHLGECPICCLPLPLESHKSMLMSCCSKMICSGCIHASEAAGLVHRCLFCRDPVAETQEDNRKKNMKRVKKNDPVAIFKMGNHCYHDEDYEGAFKYWTKATELGDVNAQFSLGQMYDRGEGVEKDEKKCIYHMEEAAIGGHFVARHNIGCAEAVKGKFERAKRHWIIAANLGWNDSLQALRMIYADGHASKEEYLGALRGYQAALDAAKSPERDEAEKKYMLESILQTLQS
jgi:hypothetical protein